MKDPHYCGLGYSPSSGALDLRNTPDPCTWVWQLYMIFTIKPYKNDENTPICSLVSFET